MSFSLVGVSGEGTTLIVNSDDLPQPPQAPNFSTQSDTTSTITPFSNFLNISSFANNFGSISTINSVLPGFSTFSNPSWNPYAPAPEPSIEELNGINNAYSTSLSSLNASLLNKGKRPWENPSPLANAAAIRKKRKQNFFEEEEATCAKCHYRRKCMKCFNCFARFCEQRCLPRYLEDPAAQEEVKISNTWLCPCCKGIEPPGKYKGSDIMRKDVEDSKDKDGDDDDDKPTNSNNSQQIITQQSPIQAHTQQSYYQDTHTQPFTHYMQQNTNFQLQHLQLQQQQQQQQQLKLQQMQQMQQQQQQMQLLQQQQQQQHMQQQLNPQQLHMQQFQPHLHNPTQQQQMLHQLPPHQAALSHPLAAQQQQMRHPQISQTLPPSSLLSPTGAKVDMTVNKKGAGGVGGGGAGGKVNGGGGGEENGNGGGGVIVGNGGAVVGVGEEGDPGEYPKETEDYCSVCGDIYSYDDNNEIIYCDGCNVAVHQACYGVNKVPAGEWMCDRCKAGVLPTCHLCSQKGGAMKELVDLQGHWVHVTCVAALYELRPLDFSKKLGPPGLLDKIDKRRYKLKCETCREVNRKEVTGPLIQCKRKRCAKAFHPICCKKKLSYCKELGIFVTYCKQHAAEAQQESPQ